MTFSNYKNIHYKVFLYAVSVVAIKIKEEIIWHFLKEQVLRW